MKHLLRNTSIALILLISLSFSAQYDISPTYTWIHLKTDYDNVYDFHSGGISFGISSNKQIGLLGRVTRFFPRGLYQDGKHFPFDEYYTSGFGGDVMLGAGYQHHFSPDLVLISGLGIHFNAFKLSSTEYESFYTFTTGVSAEAKLLYQIHPKFEIGGFINTAYDFGDFIHDGNALKYGYFLTVGAIFSMRMQKGKKDENS